MRSLISFIAVLMLFSGCAINSDILKSRMEEQKVYDWMRRLEPGIHYCYGKTKEEAESEINSLWHIEVATANTSIKQEISRDDAMELYKAAFLKTIDKYQQSLNYELANHSDKCREFRARIKVRLLADF